MATTTTTTTTLPDNPLPDEVTNVTPDPAAVTSQAQSQAVTAPGPLATSQEIRDRGSAFVGYVYRARTAGEARAAVVSTDLRQHPDRQRYRHAGERGKDEDGTTPYAIAAWRCMVVRPGRTGLGGPEEFAVEEGFEDGGERWAGKRVLGVMQREGAMDAVVVVRRWFGGTLLGSVRFAHIETCASEVCRKFRKIDEMDECVQTLKRLDNVLETLRNQLATTLERARAAEPGPSGTTLEGSRAKTNAPDYRVMQGDLDLTKAKRLVRARECAIENTKTLIEKYKTST